VEGVVGWPGKGCYWVSLTGAVWGRGGVREGLVQDGQNQV